MVDDLGQVALDNPRYVMRITGDRVEEKAELDNFIDPESTYPVIATTSELLSTGVDAKTCKLIVLDKTINSMAIFKQIIGRGTRIEEDHNKFFFTIMDFKKATTLFRDPDFDGEPVIIYEPGDGDPPVPPDPYPEDDDPIDPPETGESKKVYVSGVEARILAERIEYIGPDGTLMTESYRDFTRKQVQKEFASLDDFLRRWSGAAKKKAISELLEEYGVVLDNLAEEVGREYGDFDLICHIAFDQPPLTRKERIKNVKKRNYFTKYGEQARAVLDGLLDRYGNEGIRAIENAKVLKLKPFSDMGTPMEIIKEVFGGKENYESAVQELEQELFRDWDRAKSA
jgi:type I restriction enzyme R subunit